MSIAVETCFLIYFLVCCLHFGLLDFIKTDLFLLALNQVTLISHTQVFSLNLRMALGIMISTNVLQR